MSNVRPYAVIPAVLIVTFMHRNINASHSRWKARSNAQQCTNQSPFQRTTMHQPKTVPTHNNAPTKARYNAQQCTNQTTFRRTTMYQQKPVPTHNNAPTKARSTAQQCTNQSPFQLTTMHQPKPVPTHNIAPTKARYNAQQCTNQSTFQRTTMHQPKYVPTHNNVLAIAPVIVAYLTLRRTMRGYSDHDLLSGDSIGTNAAELTALSTYGINTAGSSETLVYISTTIQKQNTF